MKNRFPDFSLFTFSVLVLLALSPATCLAGHASWTVMVYMAGENNLGQSLMADLQEMESVGSTSDVNIVVQAETGFSREYLFADGNTHRFHVKRGWLQDFPMGYNADMASPEELSSFISWAVSAFPADHYLLVLWDHGLGWVGGQDDNQEAGSVEGAPVRGILQDMGSHSFMSLAELNQALSSAGTVFDVIEFDACLMGMWEVAHAVKDWTSFITFSQATEPSTGNPYGRIFSDLIHEPWMSGRSLAEHIVDDYLESYREPAVMDFSVTKSAVATGRIQELTDRINVLAGLLNESFSDVKDVVEEVRLATQAFPELPGSIDLGGFLAHLAEGDIKASIREEAAAIGQLLTEEIVIKHGFHNADFISVLAGSSDLSGSTGMSIFLPLGKELLPGELDQYGAVQAVQEAPEWFGFIQKFSHDTGLISDAEAAPGGFLLGIYWSSVYAGSPAGDLDLYVIEPGGVFSPWTGHSTPNGYFSLDSRVSGLDMEYYMARPMVWKGIYIPVVNYQAAGLNFWQQGNVMAYFYYLPEYGSQENYQAGPRFMGLFNPAPVQWDDNVLELLSQNYYSDWWIPTGIQKYLSRASVETKRAFWESVRQMKMKNMSERAYRAFGTVH